ncbi:MAG: hypothetical protein BWY45_03371 [Euryarchaeota archaeon ADurb.Bin294]|nr:MAG: hypothetical protein BWY45_03371 [Euryarchaeota archaeon ADurb.Bin294]
MLLSWSPQSERRASPGLIPVFWGIGIFDPRNIRVPLARPFARSSITVRRSFLRSFSSLSRASLRASSDFPESPLQLSATVFMARYLVRFCSSCCTRPDKTNRVFGDVRLFCKMASSFCASLPYGVVRSRVTDPDVPVTGLQSIMRVNGNRFPRYSRLAIPSHSMK